MVSIEVGSIAAWTSQLIVLTYSLEIKEKYLVYLRWGGSLGGCQCLLSVGSNISLCRVALYFLQKAHPVPDLFKAEYSNISLLLFCEMLFYSRFAEQKFLAGPSFLFYLVIVLENYCVSPHKNFLCLLLLPPSFQIQNGK